MKPEKAESLERKRPKKPWGASAGASFLRKPTAGSSAAGWEAPGLSRAGRAALRAPARAAEGKASEAVRAAAPV
ncbi:MAG: hypothetical protein HYV15_05000 [Elusimicrobia bacterium]|nr:hypothetical protein [Elusimicrobiota bacterium]